MISQFDSLVQQAVSSIPPPLSMNNDQWFTLINSVIQKESTFNPNAVSFTGAGIGLMQVNPNIWLSVFNVSRDQLFDPWTNISVGTQILKDYIAKYGTTGGLGAYFAGPAQRLTAAAKSYASMVMSIYSSLWSKVKAALKPSPVFWFVDNQAPDIFSFPESLPENGSAVDDFQDAFIPLQPSEQDNSLLIIGAVAVGWLLLQNRIWS